MGNKSELEKVTRVKDAEFPLVVLIDNTSACNLRCSMCDHKNIRNYRKIQQMPFVLYQKIIDEIAQENPSARVWNIFFGDPFLCQDMAERVKYAKTQGLTDVVLNTNGVLMASNKAEALIKEGLDAIYVGIDAFTEETYNKIRIGGNFNKVKENVLNYRDMLIRHGTGAQSLFVQFVESEVNAHELEEFKEFWVGEKVGVKIRPKISWAGLIEAKNLHDNSQVVRKPCYWLMQTFNVCADGEVPFCTCDLHCRIKCGNLNRNSIKEIWQGALKKYRELNKSAKFGELPEMCKNCGDWQSAYADFY